MARGAASGAGVTYFQASFGWGAWLLLVAAVLAALGAVAAILRERVVLGLRSEGGIAVAGVVESGYGRDLVEQLPALTRGELRSLQQPGRLWEGEEPIVGTVKYLEWSAAGGLRHATLRAVK